MSRTSFQSRPPGVKWGLGMAIGGNAIIIASEDLASWAGLKTPDPAAGKTASVAFGRHGRDKTVLYLTPDNAAAFGHATTLGAYLIMIGIVVFLIHLPKWIFAKETKATNPAPHPIAPEERLSRDGRPPTPKVSLTKLTIFVIGGLIVARISLSLSVALIPITQNLPLGTFIAVGIGMGIPMIIFSYVGKYLLRRFDR